MTTLILAAIFASTIAVTSVQPPIRAYMHRAGNSPAPAPPDTHSFVSREGRFSIALPDGYSRPKLEVNDVASDMGAIKLYMYMSIRSSEGACLVGYSDIKGVQLTDELRQKMLDGAREGALNNMNATLDSETPTTLEGNPGRIVRFTAEKDGQKIRGRFDYYLVNNRLYQVGFIAIAQDALEQESISAFFGSFKLMKQAATPRKGGRRGRR